jgi:hypothetical protein
VSFICSTHHGRADVKNRVVGNLDVVRLGALLQHQPRERIPLRVRRPILFTLTDGADERSVSAVTGHEIDVRIRSPIQQSESDISGYRFKMRMAVCQALTCAEPPLTWWSGHALSRNQATLSA